MSTRALVVFLCVLLCAGVLPIFAQEVSGGITGRVLDPSGAAIANASVTIKDLDRGTEWPTKTNESGIYAFPRIPPSRYELRVEAAGFKTFVQSEVVIDVNQRARIDASMQVCGVSERVSITADAALLQPHT